MKTFTEMKQLNSPRYFLSLQKNLLSSGLIGTVNSYSEGQITVIRQGNLSTKRVWQRKGNVRAGTLEETAFVMSILRLIDKIEYE